MRAFASTLFVLLATISALVTILARPLPWASDSAVLARSPGASNGVFPRGLRRTPSPPAKRTGTAVSSSRPTSPRPITPPPASGAEKSVFIAQEEAGDDDKFHWKLVVGTSLTDAVFFDVVWGTKDEGMYVRPPKGQVKQFDSVKSQGFIKGHKIGTLLKQDDARFRDIIYETYRPKYTVEDHKAGLNCQTWVIDVIKQLVNEKYLPQDAISKANQVPKK